MQETKDLIILGGGPAGYRAAEVAVKENFSVLLFEKAAVGGTCLHRGCIPTKHWLRTAHHLAKGEAFPLESWLEEKQKILATLQKGITQMLKCGGAQVVEAEARLVGREAELFVVEAGGERYTAKRVLLCTGSEIAYPPLGGLQEAREAGFALNSDDLLASPPVSGSLVIIGGGVIGLEMADALTCSGVKVTILEMLPQVGGGIEKDLQDRLQRMLKRKGVDIFTDTQVQAVDAEKHQVLALVPDKKTKEKKETSFEADHVLVCTGRRPVLRAVAAEAFPEIFNERGRLLVNERCETPVQGLYAAGDCTARIMLAHEASREAEVAVAAMAGHAAELDLTHVPSVIYTSPELASVGLTLEKARELDENAVEKSIMLGISGRFLVEYPGETGLIKGVFVGPERVLAGVHMIGGPAGEMVNLAAFLIAAKKPARELAQTVLAHPTISELFRELLLLGAES